MAGEIIIAIVFAIFIVIGAIEFFVFAKYKKYKKDLAEREEDTRNKLYEISILNELSDKIGYSLGVQSAIEVIIRSLPDIIDYTAVSYMIPLPEKINFRTYIKAPVSGRFIADIKAKMLDFLDDNFKSLEIDKKTWGINVSEESKAEVRSFFHLPLEINGVFAGLITVASGKGNFYKQKEIDTLQKIARLATGAVARLQAVVDTENSKMNALVASMTDGVVMTDVDYKVLVVNPVAKKAIGVEEKNKLSLDDFSEGLKGKFDLKDKINEGIRLDRVFVSEEISLAEKFFKIVISPVKDREETLGCVIVFRDMTREKEVQQIKDDFTAMIVHELRSPLDSIKKMIELLRSTQEKKAKIAESLQMIYGSSSEMLQLVNNLLDIAKIEAGKFALMKTPSDIRVIIKERIMFFDVAAKDAKVVMTSRFGDGLPEKVAFDPHTISQVLNNLISNALKFNRENGHIEIQAVSHEQGINLQKEAGAANIKWFIKKEALDIPDSLLIAVTNTGQGIAKEQIEKLFNKFVQAKSVFSKKGGTGLGLAITKSIIESHGGVVGAESTEGEGATFYFTVPVSPARERVPVKTK